VAVPQSLDDPGGLEIDEDGVVVGAVGIGQDPHHAHLEGIDAGEIEDVLGRRDDGVARTHAKRRRHARAEHALSEHRDLPTGLDL